MRKDLKKVKFNLTKEMSSELIKFNELKKKYSKLLSLFNKTKDEKIKKDLDKIKSEMDECKNSFIDEFRKNNRNEIMEYLQIKDQK